MQYHYAKIGFGISEYITNRTGICPCGLIEMQASPPLCAWIANSDGTYTEIEPTTEQKTSALESERDRLLKGSDWYVVRKLDRGIDIPAEISEYREALANIDDLEGYPDVKLPEQPTNIKFIW